MKNVVRTVVVGALATIITFSCFTMTATVKPLMQEYENHYLKSNNESKLEIGEANLIACYHAKDSLEFYLNNALLTDLSNYAIVKTLDFSSDIKGDLYIEELNLKEDNLNKALHILVVQDNIVQVNTTDTFPLKVGTPKKTDVYIYYELSEITKTELENSKGTDIEIVFSVK